MRKAVSSLTHFAMAFALIAVAACSPGEQAEGGPASISIDGSSTVLPLSQAVVDAYVGAVPEAPEFTLTESGTTAGFEKFCLGQVEIADASRPINTREMIDCFSNGVRYVEAPVAFDGITIIVNPSNPISAITLEELHALWAAESETPRANWRDLNPRWPAQPIMLFGPGSASGTFDYFNTAILGDRSAPRTDYSASEHDDDIVNGVAENQNALAYVGLAHYHRNRDKLKALGVDSGAGPIAPTVETISSGAYRPLSRPMFIYVNATALARPEVQAFAEYYINHAARIAPEVGYIALPDSVYPTYLERVQNRRYGTAFQGKAHAGETVQEVISRPLIEASSR